MTKVCRQCGKEFKAEKKWQALCSKECLRLELAKSDAAMKTLNKFVGGK